MPPATTAMAAARSAAAVVEATTTSALPRLQVVLAVATETLLLLVRMRTVVVVEVVAVVDRTRTVVVMNATPARRLADPHQNRNSSELLSKTQSGRPFSTLLSCTPIHFLRYGIIRHHVTVRGFGRQKFFNKVHGASSILDSLPSCSLSISSRFSALGGFP
jgi:hypothetical protein